jgi:hypothetical protein
MEILPVQMSDDVDVTVSHGPVEGMDKWIIACRACEASWLADPDNEELWWQCPNACNTGGAPQDSGGAARPYVDKHDKVLVFPPASVPYSMGVAEVRSWIAELDRAEDADSTSQPPAPAE